MTSPLTYAPGTDAPAPIDAGGDPGSATGPSGSAAGPDSAPTADPKAKAAPASNCAGFTNTTGITDSTITLSNVSDLSGPIPGLFQSAQDALRAYIAYFNSTSSVCGRKLAITTYDSRTDAGGDQQGYTDACTSSFAAVASMSAFDSGGAAAATHCGLPDIRTSVITRARWDCPICFGTLAVNPNSFHNAIPDFLRKVAPETLKNAGLIYLNTGAAAENAKTQYAALTKAGMKFKVYRGIDTSEFNYAPYVQALKSAGVEEVQFVGAYQQAARLATAMYQQGYKPKAFILDPVSYDPSFVKAVGEAGEGINFFIPIVPFEDAKSSPEMERYISWLNRVKPGAHPDFIGVFAWSAAKLFVDNAVALGGKLTRASLIAAVRKANNWTAGGIHSPMPVGAKTSARCFRWVRLTGGKFVTVGPAKFTCSEVTYVK